MPIDDATHLFLLADKVQELLKLIENLKIDNTELSIKLEAYKKGANTNYEQKISDLETEIRKHKKENKTLKEKEKLIKNKVERLSVKLDQIEI